MQSQTLGQNNRAFRVIEAGVNAIERNPGMTKAERSFDAFYEPISDIITTTVMIEIIEWPYTKSNPTDICFPRRRTCGT